MNFQLVPISSDGNQNSRNTRRTHQPTPRRGNTGRASGTWTWCPNPNPRQQQFDLYPTVPTPATTNSPGFLYPALAQQAHWGSAIHREASGGIRATRSRRNKRDGNAVAARQCSPGVGPSGEQSRVQPLRGTPAGRFLSELLYSFERFGRECPEVFQPRNPAPRLSPSAGFERLLSALHVESIHLGEGAALPGDGAGTRAHSQAPDKELPPDTSSTAATSGRRADEPIRTVGAREPVHEAPPPRVCTSPHTTDEVCKDRVHKF